MTHPLIGTHGRHSSPDDGRCGTVFSVEPGDHDRNPTLYLLRDEPDAHGQMVDCISILDFVPTDPAAFRSSLRRDYLAEARAVGTVLASGMFTYPPESLTHVATTVAEHVVELLFGRSSVVRDVKLREMAREIGKGVKS